MFSALRVGEWKFMVASTSDDDRDCLNLGGFTGVTQKYTHGRLYNLYLDPKESRSYMIRKLAYIDSFTSGIANHFRTSASTRPAPAHRRDELIMRSPRRTMPDNVVVVLLDSLNRHLLGAYGGTEFETPNLDRFAGPVVRFTDHHTGSLPCMPAAPRHPVRGARLPVEAVGLDRAVGGRHHPARCGPPGVTTMLVSDHPHLFETGGENYHTDFSAWDYQRGHESDPWKTVPDPTWMGAPTRPRFPMTTTQSHGWFRGEPDFPGPRTMAAAARWLDDNAGRHDRFLLFVDEFDPHEPFDTPEPWASRYDPDWEGPHLIWPPYVRGALRKGRARRAPGPPDPRPVRRQAVDDRPLVRADASTPSTATTSGAHRGHRLHRSRPLPGRARHLGQAARARARDTRTHPAAGGVARSARPATCDALTTSVDLFATLADVFGVDVRQRTHGRSLVPLLEGTASSIRDWALTGVWGREVHLVDGERRYARAPRATTPRSRCGRTAGRRCRCGCSSRRSPCPCPTGAPCSTACPARRIPVIRQPWDAGDPLPFWAWSGFGGNHLWNRTEDPDEVHDRLAGDDGGTVAPRAEDEAADELRTALLEPRGPRRPVRASRPGLNPQGENPVRGDVAGLTGC